MLVITGTPGTGKTTISNALSSILKLPVYHEYDIVKSFNLAEGRGEHNSLLVNPKKLEKIIRKLKPGIFEGHIVCEIKGNFAVVLRTNPFVLWKRLEKRGYNKKKIIENVAAEALDYCAIRAKENYNTICEFDTTKNTAKKNALLLLKSLETETCKSISWRKELHKLIKNGVI